jgi:aldehyde:ferredoxin oxidoreductase
MARSCPSMAIAWAGLGCVMGYEKVKAIVMRGKIKLPMQDPE